MPYPPKPPTTQAVIAALKREGFSRSEPCSPGPKDHTAGWRVRKCPWDSSLVEVLWWDDTRAIHGEGAAARRFHWLQRYADALVRSRFRCQISEKDGKVTVYARSA